MKKLTLKQLLAKLRDEEARLEKDEGAWLKSLGELGDLARILLKVQQDQADQTKLIANLAERVERLEGGMNANTKS